MSFVSEGGIVSLPSPVELEVEIQYGGKMNPLEWYKSKTVRYDSETMEFKILNYLIFNAAGVSNAKTWKQISTDLNLDCPIQDFQHGLLKDSRESDFFIGSCRKGYFLIVSQSDATSARSYFQDRIAAEEHHMSMLDLMMESIPVDFATS